MKEEKNKIKEPYRPDGTPNPPQEIDPSKRKEQNEPESPARANPEASERRNKNTEEKKEPGKKLLGESEIEIDDETTI